MKSLRWALGIYMAIAAIGRADADVSIKPGGTAYAVRQGPTAILNAASHAACEDEARRRTTNPLATPVRTFQIRSGGGSLLETVSSLEVCLARPTQRLQADGAFRPADPNRPESNVNSCVATTKYSTAFQPPECRATFNWIATYTGLPVTTEPPPPTCPPTPPDQTRPGACPSGSTSSWTQTGVTAFGPAPECAPTVTWAPTTPPAGGCTAIPTCPPPPASQTRQGACPAGTTSNWTQRSTSTVGPPTLCQVTTTWSPTTAPAGGCIAVTVPAGAAALSWPGYDDARATGFRIVFGTRSNFLTRQVEVGPTARSHMVTGLTAGTYYFSIIARGPCRGTVGSPLDPYICHDSYLSGVVSKTVR